MKIGIAVSSWNNTYKQLDKCLLSIKNQTYKTQLMVCLNDGFWNVNVINKHSLLLKEFRIYYDNLGFAGNWNRTISLLSDCDYITFVHADDFIDKYHIQLMANSIKDNDICFATLRYKESFYRKLRYAIKHMNVDYLLYPRKSETDINCSLDNLIRQNMFPVIALIKKTTWDKLKGYSDDVFYCDWDLWIRARIMGCTMTSCIIPTYNYTIHKSKLTKQESENARNQIRQKYEN